MGEPAKIKAFDEKAFYHILGQALRAARQKRGLTREELVSRLPTEIGDRTLLSYEQGIRRPNVSRIMELCIALGITASSLLAEVERAMSDPTELPIYLNLQKMVCDAYARSHVSERVMRWASHHLRVDPIAGAILLSPDLIRELAIAFEMSHADLAKVFLAFSVSHD